MDLLHRYWLTVVVFLPLVGVIPVALVRGRNAVRWTAFSFALATQAGSLLLIYLFDWRASGPYAWAENGGVVQSKFHIDLIRPAHVQYLVGLDGLNLPLIVLTALIFVLAFAAAWGQHGRSRTFLALLLALEGGLLGTLASLDFVMLFIFMQASAVLVGLLVGRGRGVIYPLLMSASAVAILIVILKLAALGTFDLVRLASLNKPRMEGAFLLLLFAFLVRMAAPPFHGWLVAAQDRAPTPIGLVLAGVVPAIGGYGLLRVAYPLFPQAATAAWLLPATLAVLALVYMSLCALGERSIRPLAVYATLFGMGFFLLGTAMLTPTSVNGAVFMLVSVGLGGAAMRAVSGLHELPATPTRRAFTTLAILALLGCPGTCGFIGQIMVLIGSFAACHPDAILYAHARQQADVGRFLLQTRILCVAACFVGVLMSGAMVTLVAHQFTGPPQSADSPDLNHREVSTLATLTTVIILLGILPILLVALTNQTLAAILKIVP